MDFNAYPKPVRALTQHAREALRGWLPEAKETQDPSAKLFAYVYGPGYRGVVCTLILSRSGVKLGIAGGASFADPHKLLRGAGKVHRHIPLKAEADLRQPGVREMVAAASAACLERLGRAATGFRGID